MTNKFVLSSILYLLATAAGCNSVDNAIDCGAICSKYKDCFDSDYDTAACESRCRSNAEQPDYEAKVEACETCIDSRSCTGAAFGCATECAAVVP